MWTYNTTYALYDEKKDQQNEEKLLSWSFYFFSKDAKRYIVFAHFHYILLED